MEAVKFVKGSDTLIEGLAIPFGGPVGGKDLDGEDFGPDTDYALDWFPQGRPVIYHHGVDGAMKTAVQGRQTEHEITDEGVWVRGQLDKSAKYHATVSRLIAAGKLFFSSGSLSHLVEVGSGGHITRWPWVELSLTPTPANPLAVIHTKSTDLIEHLNAVELPVPGQLIAAALKALDQQDAAPDPASFTEHIVRVSDDVRGLVDHAREHADMRAKAGRVLSDASRKRLQTALESRAALIAAFDDLAAFLDETDPSAEAKAADAYWAAVLQAEMTQSRLLGVDMN